jgi:hypothetical protein
MAIGGHFPQFTPNLTCPLCLVPPAPASDIRALAGLLTITTAVQGQKSGAKHAKKREKTGKQAGKAQLLPDQGVRSLSRVRPAT